LVWAPSVRANDKKIVTIKSGQVAPFAGVLYSNAAHALLVARTKSQDERYKLKCDLQLGKLRVSLDSKLKLKEIELDTERKAHEGTRKLTKQQKDLLLNELKRVKKVPWYKSPVFTFTTGVVVTVGLTALAVYAVDQIRK
jgi:hypothetical protein